MNKWKAEITNNLDDDYNLMIEILNNDEYIGRILYLNEELVFQLYKSDKMVDLPVDWLLNILNKAKEDLRKNR